MALSALEWAFWAVAMVGLLAIFFVPSLPIWAAVPAFVVVGGFALYLNGYSVLGAILGVLGVIALTGWLYIRHQGKADSERTSNP
jgi:hypothetical protein